MTFREKLQTDTFAVTYEVGPPKGIETDRILQALEPVRARVDAVNVTDLQSSVMRLGALAVSSILKARGYETIMQLTCRDRNRLALQSDLLSAAALGISNILVLTGDHPARGDHPEAKPVFDLDSTQLLQTAHKLSTGFDFNGHPLEGKPPQFFLGAAVNPCADPLEPEIIKMEKKVQCGAQFFQTQAVFDPACFERFLARIRHLNVPVLAGIVVLKSGKMGRYMNENIPGIIVPDAYIKALDEAGDRTAAAVEMTGRLIRQLKSLCKGVHLMPIGWHAIMPRVLDAAGL